MTKASDATLAGLTILRCGLGRDSLAMLLLLLEGGLVVPGAHLRVQDVDAVVFTDTGEEWPSTYALIPRVRTLCEAAELSFYVQWKPDLEASSAQVAASITEGKIVEPAWRTSNLSIDAKCRTGWYHRRVRLMWDYMSRGMVVPFRDGGCTENHKILPMRRMLEDLAYARFGVPTNRVWSTLVRRGQARPHRLLIGIAADEAHRAVPRLSPDFAYEESLYPLVEMGIEKADEAAILARYGLNHVHKSGCMMCKFQPVGWYWALSVSHPDAFEAIVRYETLALDHGRKKGNGQYLFPSTKGVDGKPLRLPEAVAAWRQGNPNATVETVMSKDYKRCDVNGRPMRVSGGAS